MASGCVFANVVRLFERETRRIDGQSQSPVLEVGDGDGRRRNHEAGRHLESSPEGLPSVSLAASRPTA